jgi:hypothetical protein
MSQSPDVENFAHLTVEPDLPGAHECQLYVSLVAVDPRKLSNQITTQSTPDTPAPPGDVPSAQTQPDQRRATVAGSRYKAVVFAVA